MLPHIIIPAPNEDAEKEVERQQQEERRRWMQQYRDVIDPLRLPRNVRFWHDPLWRERFVSLTKARAMDHPGWLAVAALFAMGAAAFLTTWIIMFRTSLPV